MKKMDKSVLIWSVLVFAWNIVTVWKLFNHTFDFTPFNIFSDLVMGPLVFIYQMLLLKKEIEKIKE